MIISKDFGEFVNEHVAAQERINHWRFLGCLSCVYNNKCKNKSRNPKRCFKHISSICFRCQINDTCKESGLKWICEDYISKENKSNVEFFKSEELDGNRI